jgi:transcriptional regulator with XRE-family HTH domain
MEFLLKSILKTRGITQKELAGRTGLSERFVSDLCTNRRNLVPRESVALIARELGISDVSELIRLH